MISVLAILFFLILLGAISSLRFERPGGVLERGVPIWSEPIDIELANYLAQLPEGFRVGGVFSQNADFLSSFIRKEQNLALIRVVRNGRGSWPWKYIGVANLRLNPAIIDYRIELIALLGTVLVLLLSFVEYFVSGFNSQALLIPAILFLFTVISHFSERNRILSYLRACMREDNKKDQSVGDTIGTEQAIKTTPIDKRSYISKIRGYDQ